MGEDHSGFLLKNDVWAGGRKFEADPPRGRGLNGNYASRAKKTRTGIKKTKKKKLDPENPTNGKRAQRRRHKQPGGEEREIIPGRTF